MSKHKQKPDKTNWEYFPTEKEKWNGSRLKRQNRNKKRRKGTGAFHSEKQKLFSSISELSENVSDKNKSHLE